MYDFYEILDFCGWDIDEAAALAATLNAAIEEALDEVGLEKL